MRLPSSNRLAAAAALVIAGAPALAQSVRMCGNGPSETYGISSFSCESCADRDLGDGGTLLLFDAEPVVRRIKGNTGVRVGDVIVAVDGKPITTREGAVLFNDAPVARHVLRVRRGAAMQDVVIPAVEGCPAVELAHRTQTGVSYHDGRMTRGVTTYHFREMGLFRQSSPADVVDELQTNIEALEAKIDAIGVALARGIRDTLGSVTRAGGGAPADSRVELLQGLARSIPDLAGEVTGLAIRIETLRRMIGPDDSRFGFAVVCARCIRAKAPSGTYYMIYREPPTVALIRGESPAALAGLRVNDRLLEIDGVSMVTDAGALAFDRASAPGSGKDRIRLTILRDGRRQDLTLVIK
jgi:membrane-associated protease RseP (regulator of RpoE activity)